MTKKIIPKLIGTYLNTLAAVAPSRAGRVGFNVFCTPLAPPVKPHHKQFLEKASLFTFKSGGVDIQGYQWGSGQKKILFLHGWQSHSYRWKKYIEAFSEEEYTLYAFDAPAHGLSKGKYANIPIYSEAIKVFLEQLGAMDTVVAHSMGSFSTLHLLYNHPQFDLGRLVLLGSPGEANDFISFYKNFTGLNDRTFKYIIDYFKQTLGQTPDYYSAPKFATALKIPGLIIHDEGDEEAPYAHAQRIHTAWPQSQLMTTQGFGHNLRAPEVVEMVKDFVMKEQLQKIGAR
ncbi:MAG TPA: alpha/beta hydrolase [Cyclobacteriaceae bacterium]|nr:alpha/beta hydrolase [Cyclobacteriaceae bacterium]HNP07832.1 alpha/beta hydrolase [Cyclobacteriaceae bacterium]HRK53639.1 alpha/beta hydrolase [Cyclobacteriaceae bacterium]